MAVPACFVFSSEWSALGKLLVLDGMETRWIACSFALLHVLDVLLPSSNLSPHFIGSPHFHILLHSRFLPV